MLLQRDARLPLGTRTGGTFTRSRRFPALDTLTEVMRKEAAGPTADVDLTTVLTRAEFGFVSREAWTDVLLQVYKVFVLARVTPESLSRPLAQIEQAGGVAQRFALHLSTDPLDSNVHSSARAKM
uniref:Uncharacterized protein n=1 Tax=Eptatretus burgeri TaxID=7764 RepID=A0A8C4R544_EPTBU